MHLHTNDRSNRRPRPVLPSPIQSVHTRCLLSGRQHCHTPGHSTVSTPTLEVKEFDARGAREDGRTLPVRNTNPHKWHRTPPGALFPKACRQDRVPGYDIRLVGEWSVRTGA